MPSVGSGSRIPRGGTAGQILHKKSEVDFDLKWGEPDDVRGPQGVKGDQGDTGPQGAKGDTGAAGAQGLKGDTGATGSQGPKGDTGATGAQGLKGDTGTAGATGSQGPKGDTGNTGAQGIQGPKGDTGNTGAQGIAGVAGTAGAQGPAGPGVPVGGTSGQVLTKSSASDYATSWTTPSGGSSGGGSNFAPWVPGRTFFAPGNNNFINSAQSTGSTYFFPLMVPNACKIVTIGIYCSAVVAGQKSTVGLWTDNPTATSGGPASWITWYQADHSSSGFLTTTLNYTITGPTLLWYSISPTSASITYRSWSFGSQLVNFAALSNPTNSANRATTSFFGLTTPPASVATTSMTSPAIDVPILFVQVTA